MKGRYVILIILFLFSFVFVSAVSAEDGSMSTRFGIHVIGGVGFANNVRMADRLNIRRDLAKAFYNGEENEDKREEPLGYAGIELEPRFFYHNIVCAVSVGYYNVNNGVREVNGSVGPTPVTYRTELDLKFIAYRGTVYYKITLDDDSFVLLGWGIGYYSGTMEESFGLVGSEQSDKDTQSSIGWHSALEYNSIFFNSVNLSVGILSRFAEVYDFRVNEADEDDEFSGGLTGLYLYAGVGYLL